MKRLIMLLLLTVSLNVLAESENVPTIYSVIPTYNANSISLKVTGINFARKNRNSQLYLSIGKDLSNVNTTISNFTNTGFDVTFPNLANGDYLLRVSTDVSFEKEHSTAFEITLGAIGPKGEKGDKGDPGLVGPQGAKGDAGPTGAQGPQGLKGETGATGAQGSKGDTGLTGPAGPQGTKGDMGTPGPQGDQGIPGPVGSQGAKGDTGPTGAQGPQGLKGDTGAVGPAGAQGPKGDTGLTGPAGPQGPQGIQGETGSVGPAGPQGLQGPIGYGAMGLEGPQGPQGQPGPQGPTGAPGLSGFHIVPGPMITINPGDRQVQVISCNPGEVALSASFLNSGGGVGVTTASYNQATVSGGSKATWVFSSKNIDPFAVSTFVGFISCVTIAP